MKPKDKNILEAQAVWATETDKEPVPAVSLIVARYELDYEIIITADEMRAMLKECDPDCDED